MNSTVQANTALTKGQVVTASPAKQSVRQHTETH